MRFQLTAAAAMLATTTALPAHAGRPLQTEDAGVLEGAACEVEGVHERLRDGGSSARGSNLAFGCGIGWSSQLGASASRSRAGDASSHGVAAGGKTQLWRGSGDAAPALTLAWSAAYERADGHLHHAGDDVLLVVSLPVRHGSVHLNLGHTRDRLARQTLAPWGIAFEHDPIDVAGIGLAPMAEIVGDDRGSRSWNLALRATLLPEKFFVDVSYGRQFGAGRARLATAGFKVAF